MPERLRTELGPPDEEIRLLWQTLLEDRRRLDGLDSVARQEHETRIRILEAETSRVLGARGDSRDIGILGRIESDVAAIAKRSTINLSALVMILIGIVGDLFLRLTYHP